MVGGKIIAVYEPEPGQAVLDVCEEDNFVYVHVDAKAGIFTLGDTVWWQGNDLYWTPYDKSIGDHRLTKLRYSVSGRYSGPGRLVRGDGPPL